MSKYDCVYSVGCSFSVGANIMDKNNKFAGKKLQYAQLVADELGVPCFNQGKPGAGNHYIIRTLYNFISSNIIYKNPLILIATSGLSRKEILSVENSIFSDHHIFDFDINNKDCPNYEHRALKISDTVNTDDYRNWINFEQRYIYDHENEKLKAQREYDMACALVTLKGYDYLIWNSLMDVVNSGIHGNNFLSYDIDTQGTGRKYTHNDTRQTVWSTEPDNCWYHYLYNENYKEYGNFNIENRSSMPPWGKYFSGGHPSPDANRVQKDRILNQLLKI